MEMVGDYLFYKILVSEKNQLKRTESVNYADRMSTSTSGAGAFRHIPLKERLQRQGSTSMVLQRRQSSVAAAYANDDECDSANSVPSSRKSTLQQLRQYNQQKQTGVESPELVRRGSRRSSVLTGGGGFSSPRFRRANESIDNRRFGSIRRQHTASASSDTSAGSQRINSARRETPTKKPPPLLRAGTVAAIKFKPPSLSSTNSSPYSTPRSACNVKSSPIVVEKYQAEVAVNKLERSHHFVNRCKSDDRTRFDSNELTDEDEEGINALGLPPRNDDVFLNTHKRITSPRKSLPGIDEKSITENYQNQPAQVVHGLQEQIEKLDLTEISHGVETARSEPNEQNRQNSAKSDCSLDEQKRLHLLRQCNFSSVAAEQEARLPINPYRLHKLSVSGSECCEVISETDICDDCESDEEEKNNCLKAVDEVQNTFLSSSTTPATAPPAVGYRRSFSDSCLLWLESVTGECDCCLSVCSLPLVADGAHWSTLTGGNSTTTAMEQKEYARRDKPKSVPVDQGDEIMLEFYLPHLADAGTFNTIFPFSMFWDWRQNKVSRKLHMQRSRRDDGVNLSAGAMMGLDDPSSTSNGGGTLAKTSTVTAPCRQALHHHHNRNNNNSPAVVRSASVHHYGRSCREVKCAQTELSLLRVDEKLNAYLTALQPSSSAVNTQTPTSSSQKGMDTLANHFFEYQTFVNIPDKAIQMHRTPHSCAGVDNAASWGPKSMSRTGRHLPAKAARPSRAGGGDSDRSRSGGGAAMHRHSHRASVKNEYKEWGERHGDLKPEKLAHKDLWAKFLQPANDSIGDAFETDFEEKLLRVERLPLPEKLKREDPFSEFDATLTAPFQELSTTYSPSSSYVLVILTYAPAVQFMTVTVKKATGLPYNREPTARVMLFNGSSLSDQKQTTVSVGGAAGGNVFNSVRSGSHSVKQRDFSEAFLFHVSPSQLASCHIVVEVWDHALVGETSSRGRRCAVSVGHVALGPQAIGQGRLHWHQMAKRPGLPCCMWHKLVVSNRNRHSYSVPW